MVASASSSKTQWPSSLCSFRSASVAAPIEAAMGSPAVIPAKLWSNLALNAGPFAKGPALSAKLLHSFAGITAGDPIAASIGAATDALLKLQRDDGHWVFELEADATIPAEYVLLVHYLAEAPNLELERKIGIYLRRIRGLHGGWPLFHDGAFDLSATVKA